jgi:hypothetical protein
MTGLVLRKPTAAVPVVRDDADFFAIMDMGQHLVETGFLPEHIKTGAQAAAIVMAGRELGMGPMRALRSLVLVKGKVQEMADSQLSRFKADGGRAVFKELTHERAVLWLRHPNGDEHEEVFTMADAVKAGIKSHMYEKHPKPMLRSRAITAALKSIGWEGGAGIYDPDEDVEDEVPRPMAAESAPLPPRAEVTGTLRLPGNKTSFGGHGGQLLTECPSSLLASFITWVSAKDEDRTRRYAMHAAAAEEILLRRQAEEEAAAAAGEPDVPVGEGLAA